METSPVYQVLRGDKKDLGCEYHDSSNKNKEDVIYRCGVTLTCRRRPENVVDCRRLS
jgi:hypothetical protein